MTNATSSAAAIISASALAASAYYLISTKSRKPCVDTGEEHEKKLSRTSSAKSIISTVAPDIDPSLRSVLISLTEATAEISRILSVGHDTSAAGSQNVSGDNQLVLDISCDQAAFRELRHCEGKAVAVAASEETPVVTKLHPDDQVEGKRYAVGFDPLDGSSIIASNFTVGSIFGVWPCLESGDIGESSILGRTGREQVASAMSMYGPRTTIILAIPSSSIEGRGRVFELTLLNERKSWSLSGSDIKLPSSKKVFAPGNLRASNDNEQYGALVKHWLNQRYTLRYTGGMVPDVYHMFMKGGGIFTNVSSKKAHAKLRLLYEVAPIGLIVECAGGNAIHEEKDVSVLDISIDDIDQRLGVCFGSVDEVEVYRQFMFTI